MRNVLVHDYFRINQESTILRVNLEAAEEICRQLRLRNFGKLSFRADPDFHAEQFKIVNVNSNEELARVGG